MDFIHRNLSPDFTIVTNRKYVVPDSFPHTSSVGRKADTINFLQQRKFTDI